ncbi:Sec-independent protein translocase protein TatB [Devosia rhodophyticola]|uniref:Sec-independent protein translocase protein TatB n=1 Tax=Devosia rhodophyticola TaxID=3026423 RepID=A0ABY7YX56_9HYPH|nr:Sec-independent protein translocase protein TatB [Devosia rhodophyticola]WDR05757.1 Sec-independent protein translocase protein TatB [Devosia rhodophyticola]
MLGFGWSEMMIIGVVALIVIGPKDLPMVMGRVGKVIGQIKRMGNEFQREINKTTGLNEIRNLRSSITEPLKKTTDEIRKEFNALTPTGVEPSGALKPKDPKVESVVDEIHAAAGMTTASAKTEPLKANPAPKKKPAKAKAVNSSRVASNDLAAVGTARPEAATSKNAAGTSTARARPSRAKATTTAKPAAARKATANSSFAQVEAGTAPGSKPAAKKTVTKKAAVRKPAAKKATPRKAAVEKPVARSTNSEASANKLDVGTVTDSAKAGEV